MQIPHENIYLDEIFHSLIENQAVEEVMVQSSLDFYNRFFLVPKQKEVEANLGCKQTELVSQNRNFKIETAETPRLPLQQGEWVTSLGLRDAYFHIPISQRLRKYLWFHLNGQTYHFRALPFGLATALLVSKEVKLLLQSKGISIHQYLDDWLFRALCQNRNRKLAHEIPRLSWPFIKTWVRG